MVTSSFEFRQAAFKLRGFRSVFVLVELDQSNGASMQPTLQNYPGNPLSMPLKDTNSGLPVRAMRGV